MTMRSEEAVAKRVLEKIFPGAEMKFQPEQSNGEYDFDLSFSDGKVAAVEVTSSRNQTLTQMSAEIFGKKKGGPTIPAIKCVKSRSIYPAIKPDIPEIRKKVDRYLAEVEAAGIECFDLDDLWKSTCPACVTNICNDLKLTMGMVIDSSGAPQIRINGVVSGEAVDATSATEAGEREIEANKDKLGRAKKFEHHLFVYIDQLNGGPFTGLTSFEPPNVLPNLAPEITHIWLATEIQKDQFVLWGASSMEAWKRFQLD